MNPAFTEKLLTWNSTLNERKMPWKGEKDPYKIWLSEIILQQTRVDQGLAYYERFIESFPTIIDLANAPDEKVFKLWEGLGYYSRCKNLIETARTIVFDLNSIFPNTYESILQLKGIGPYTASAIASFAFNLPYAVVDGNVNRVLARYFGITTPIDSTPGKKLFSDLATALIDRELPAEYNQAIMDFGATICKPQIPLCEHCVQQPDCVAFELGRVNDLPIKEKTITKKERWFNYFVVVVDDKLYIRKRTGKDIWQNLHEFILEETTAFVPTYSELAFFKSIGAAHPYHILSVSKPFRQILSHQHINGQFITIKLDSPIKNMVDYQLIDRTQLTDLAFPGIINKFLESSRL
ncbi:MAG: A/G-specific adenine glycosylase [Chitinophagaceae bacterium]|nr:A/G-specific adenine glycosylase [Chitinophagaceae bacterium]